MEIDLFNRQRYNLSEQDLKTSIFDRQQIWRRIKDLSYVDILVVGGGIHATAFARVAALAGLSVVLCTGRDYTQEEIVAEENFSSQQSLLKYFLSLRSFYKTFVDEKGYLESSSHLVDFNRWSMPIAHLPGIRRLAINLKAKILKKCIPEFTAVVANSVAGSCIVFPRYNPNYRRLAMENLIAAGQEGALCLNYTQIISHQWGINGFLVAVRNKLAADRADLHCGAIVDCSSGEIEGLGGAPKSAVDMRVGRRRVLNLFFETTWPRPGLYFPLNQGSFDLIQVFPGEAVVRVVARSRELTSHEQAEPSAAEIALVGGLLSEQRDGRHLAKAKLVYANTSYEQVLVNNRNKVKDCYLGRWVSKGGVLRLLAGHPAAAYQMVANGLQELFLKSGIKDREPIALASRLLPGAASLQERKEEFFQKASRHNLTEDVIQRTIRRLGGRVVGFQDDDFRLSETKLYLMGELRLAMLEEQVTCIEDLIERRLELNRIRGLASNDISSIQKEFSMIQGIGEK